MLDGNCQMQGFHHLQVVCRKQCSGNQYRDHQMELEPLAEWCLPRVECQLQKETKHSYFWGMTEKLKIRRKLHMFCACTEFHLSSTWTPTCAYRNDISKQSKVETIEIYPEANFMLLNLLYLEHSRMFMARNLPGMC